MESLLSTGGNELFQWVSKAVMILGAWWVYHQLRRSHDSGEQATAKWKTGIEADIKHNRELIDREITQLRKDLERHERRDDRIFGALAKLDETQGKMLERLATIESDIRHISDDK